MRPVRVLPAQDPQAVLAAVRQVLSDTDQALLPVPAPVPAGADDRGQIGPVPQRVAVLIETSGSTAAPKRVMLSADALLASAAASSVALGGAGQWLLALPAHYIAGVQVLVRSIAAGTEPVLLPAGRFDPAVFADHARRLVEPLRFTSLVPVQLARLLDAALNDPGILAVLQRFTGILVGGQAVSAALMDTAERLGIRVVSTYGSSETAGGCVYNGVPIGNTVVRVVDGQLEISGSVLAEGYLDDPDRSRDRFVVDDHGVRWYRTGDLGAVAPDGTVRVTGRADNVIISGGEKVSLDAVEALVRSLPGLADALVLRAVHPEWGQVPVVVLAAGEAPALGPVRTAVAQALGRPARPDRFVLVPRIPLLASGKPDRQALQAAVER